MKKFLIDPVKSMFTTLTKPREGHLRGLLLLQIFTYGLIWFNYQLSTQEYLYMLKMFKSYDENQYAYYTAIKNSLISFFMVVFFPFIKIHESMYCILGKLIQNTQNSKNSMNFFAQITSCTKLKNSTFCTSLKVDTQICLNMKDWKFRQT